MEIHSQNVNVGERDENARRKKLIPAFLSNVAIDNFAALRNSYGNNMVHYILLGYGRKEYCTNTGCKEIFHLGAACRRDFYVGIFSYPKTRYETESHHVKRTLPTILRDHKKSLQLSLSITLTLTIIQFAPREIHSSYTWGSLPWNLEFNVNI